MDEAREGCEDRPTRAPLRCFSSPAVFYTITNYSESTLFGAASPRRELIMVFYPCGKLVEDDDRAYSGGERPNYNRLLQPP